jgi:hypothetical protein
MDLACSILQIDLSVILPIHKCCYRVLHITSLLIIASMRKVVTHGKKATFSNHCPNFGASNLRNLLRVLLRPNLSEKL